MVKKDWKKTSRGFMRKDHSLGIRKTFYKNAWTNKPYEKGVAGIKFKVEVYQVIREGKGKVMTENLYRNMREADKYMEEFMRSN